MRATCSAASRCAASWNLGSGTLTSVTAWRFWDWSPANDRDFTGLPITTLSQNPTQQDQFTQEFRYAGEGNGFDYVVGVFGFYQKIHTTGIAAARVRRRAAGCWPPATRSPTIRPCSTG